MAGYTDALAIQAVKDIYALYARAKVKPDMVNGAVWVARMVNDSHTGWTWDEAKARRLEQLRVALGLPVLGSPSASPSTSPSGSPSSSASKSPSASASRTPSQSPSLSGSATPSPSVSPSPSAPAPGVAVRIGIDAGIPENK
jgi:hypothetical protein